MNDLDDIRRAIDDDIYAHGKVLEPTDAVRRAIARRRTLNRVAVAGTSALVAAAAVAAVTLIRPHTNTSENTVGQRTTNATATGPTPDPSLTPPPRGTTSPDPSTTTGVEPLPETSTTVPPSPDLSRGSALPNGGLDHLFAAIQWRGSSGALVVMDLATGAIIHTYTTGITSATFDVLRLGDEAYFVATTDSRGCATGWSGINLVTGNPVAAPSALSDHPIQAAEISPYGLVVTSDGGCVTPSKLQTYTPENVGAEGKVRYSLTDVTQVAAHIIALSPTGGGAAYVKDDGVNVSGVVDFQRPKAIVDPNFGTAKIALPTGCTASALTFHTTDLIVGATCMRADGSSGLSILSFELAGALTMRRDITSHFKEASISDVAVQDNAIYYVINSEGLEAHTYRLTEDKTDPEFAAPNLFHIASAP